MLVQAGGLAELVDVEHGFSAGLSNQEALLKYQLASIQYTTYAGIID